MVQLGKRCEDIKNKLLIQKAIFIAVEVVCS